MTTRFTYNEEAIVELLRASWDPALAYGIPNPLRADGDMPRGSTDPAHGGSWLAHVADIHTAWKKAPLTRLERIRLFLYYGAGWTGREIATYHGASEPAISQSLKRGVQRLVAYLDGEEIDE